MRNPQANEQHYNAWRCHSDSQHLKSVKTPPVVKLPKNTDPGLGTTGLSVVSIFALYPTHILVPCGAYAEFRLGFQRIAFGIAAEFLQTGCPFCRTRPTNSFKALRSRTEKRMRISNITTLYKNRKNNRVDADRTIGFRARSAEERSN